MAAARRWLSIVVDGSTAMGPYWRKIVSEYLVNIVRSFFANSRGEASPSEEGKIADTPFTLLVFGPCLNGVVFRNITFNGIHVLNLLKIKTWIRCNEARVEGSDFDRKKELCFVLDHCNCFHVIDIPGGYPTCEVGLIMYNPNPNLGRNVQYMNWTNNMEQFLALLPFLSFKGYNLGHTAAEGLAEALGMFPRDRMTEQQYFDCERHCILVGTGEPVAERMLVPLPRVHQGKFIHGQIRILLANFLDVARMFVPLRISLSVITPTLHPLFVSMFNEGNSLDKSTPIMDYGNGQITVLLSNNFKEAKNVHCRGMESMKTTTSIPINFANNHQGDLFSASSMNIGQPSIQGFQNVRRESASKLPMVTSQATTNEMIAPTPGCFVPTNSYEGIMSMLNNDNNNYQQVQPRKKSKTSVPTSEEEDSLAYLFQLDQPVSLDEILGQGQTQVGGESSQVLRDVVPPSVTRGTTSTIQLTSNSSERMNISISPGIVVSNACSSSVGEGSSFALVQELAGNMGVVNPMFSSENCLNSSLLLPQNNPQFWPAGSNPLYPSQAGASFGDSSFLNTIGNSITQFESPSFPMLPYGCASVSVDNSGSTSSHFGNSLTQFQSPNSQVNLYDCASVGPNGSAIVGDRAGTSNFVGNSISQFQSSSFPVHPYGSPSAGGIACASASTDAIVVASAAANANASPYGSCQQITRHRQFEMSGIDPLGVPSAMVANPLASPVPMMPQYNQTQFLLCQSFLPDFKDFVPAWEGYLVGSIHPYCAFFNQAKTWRKKTSPVTLTYQWSSTLEINLYIPKKAVIHTLRTYGGVLDVVIIEVTQFDNLDLYHHLMSNNLCAKIAVSSHTLVLSTTESKHCYLGTIFPGDAVFVEPL